MSPMEAPTLGHRWVPGQQMSQELCSEELVRVPTLSLHAERPRLGADPLTLALNASHHGARVPWHSGLSHLCSLEDTGPVLGDK